MCLMQNRELGRKEVKQWIEIRIWTGMGWREGGRSEAKSGEHKDSQVRASTSVFAVLDTHSLCRAHSNTLFCRFHSSTLMLRSNRLNGFLEVIHLIRRERIFIPLLTPELILSYTHWQSIVTLVGEGFNRKGKYKGIRPLTLRRAAHVSAELGCGGTKRHTQKYTVLSTVTAMTHKL